MILLCSINSSAQQVIVNSQGEKIVIYPDGSWRHYQTADSSLLKEKAQREDINKMPEKQADPHEQLHHINPDHEETYRQSQAFLNKIRQEELELRKALRTATTNKFDTEARLKEANENKDIIEPDLLASLEDQMEAQTDMLKHTRKRLIKVSKILRKANGLAQLDPEKKFATIQKLEAKFQAYLAYSENQAIKGNPSPSVADGESRASKASDKRDKSPTKQQTTKSSPPSAIHRFMDEEIRSWKGMPPTDYVQAPSGCQFLSRETNEKNEIVKQELAKTIIFTHTDDELRPYFGDDELVTCTASMLQIGENIYLNMDFRIASPNAMKNFGPLKSGSLLRIKLLNGIYVNLYNMRQDAGKIDPYSGHTLYSGRYVIGKSERRFLEKSGVEFVRVVWGTGFEDYPVYALDFFKDQFSCLEQVVN